MKKIAFIICVNDECYYQECLFYIERLYLPEGVELEVYPAASLLHVMGGTNPAIHFGRGCSSF